MFLEKPSARSPAPDDFPLQALGHPKTKWSYVFRKRNIHFVVGVHYILIGPLFYISKLWCGSKLFHRASKSIPNQRNRRWITEVDSKWTESTPNQRNLRQITESDKIPTRTDAKSPHSAKSQPKSTPDHRNQRHHHPNRHQIIEIKKVLLIFSKPGNHTYASF